ncbi:MAG: hypothetical protein IT445_13530 [Phycisphaeraceae bacterium]|nr:hypothetical protein [Phycisphaeraceae bacterium]
MTMNALKLRVSDLHDETEQGGPRLRVRPIVGPSHDQPAYRLLERDLEQHVLVTEVSEAGQVPHLMIENTLDERVLLIDGQELVGAKQNRILNADVLVPAKATLTVPVSCVEQGRWGYRSQQFTPGRSASYRVRRGKLDRIHENLKRQRGHDADQTAVWDEVQASLISSKSYSVTAALSDAYMQRGQDLDRVRRQLKLPQDAVGVAVFDSITLLGVDLFDRHAALAYFWECLVDSYAIEMLDDPVDPVAPQDSVEGQAICTLLAELADGNWSDFDSPGEGRDWRLEHPQYAGAALVWQEKVVIHLQLFPKSDSRDGGTDQLRWHRRIRRPYGRGDQQVD